MPYRIFCDGVRRKSQLRPLFPPPEVEPLPLTSPLLKFDNVLFAGHTAGMDNESKYDTFKMCAESLVKLHNGGWPAECVVNLRGVTGWKWQK